MARKKNTDVQALRAEVMKRHRAAGAKISRNRKKGIELGGTVHDPRKDVKLVKNYNKRQLEAHLKRLNTFNARPVNWVKSTGGLIPITSAAYYKRLEKQFNQIGKKHSETWGHIHSPTSGMTLAERDATLVNKNQKRSAGAAAYNPFTPKDLDISTVNGPEALDILTKAMEAKLKPGFEQAQINDARDQLNSMLIRIGGADSDMTALASYLTDSQLNILWNYEQFANAISDLYEEYKLLTTEEEDRWQQSSRNDYYNDAMELIEWGLSLDTQSKSVADQSSKPGNQESERSVNVNTSKAKNSTRSKKG